MRRINILILEDTSYVPGKENEYIDEISKKYKNHVLVNIKLITKKNDYEKIASIISEQPFDIAVLDYKLDMIDKEKNGWTYIPNILNEYRYCNIILATNLINIKDETEKLSDNIQDFISDKPNIKYIPKGAGFTHRVCAYVDEIIDNLKARWELQKLICKCAVKSYKIFSDTIVEDLIKKLPENKPGKEDTMYLDIIAEDVIRVEFAPKIHEHKIVICLEEGGVENKLIYRIDRPLFYIFSDPLDGSTSLKTWINNISIKVSDDLLSLLTKHPKLDEYSEFFKVDEENKSIVFMKLAEIVNIKNELFQLNYSSEWENIINSLDSFSERLKREFKDFINDQKEIIRWKEKYGPIELNAPMISIVLAERHQVIGNVIINLLTGDIYFSDDYGNHKFKLDNKIDYNDNQISEIIEQMHKEENRLLFKTSISDSSKLFLCTLQSKKYEKLGEINQKNLQFLIHFRECLQSHVPHDYDMRRSFKKRVQRNDFTPGPGRILFLTEIAEKYSQNVGDDEKEIYSCIFSSGEPITEWVGWFAFLRHIQHISVYCLRPGNANICQHRIQRDDVKGTMRPQEIASMFKNGKNIGMMDFEVLHTGYKGAMHNYTDSIVVFFNTDKSWLKIVNRKLDERMPEEFVKIAP